MQIGVQEVCTLPNSKKESKELPSNTQITKIENLAGRREESVFLLAKQLAYCKQIPLQTPILIHEINFLFLSKINLQLLK
jgi:hypothetical protein